jgi:uncharacterized membrane protein YdjX (TVP38/TMEM64 family)
MLLAIAVLALVGLSIIIRGQLNIEWSVASLRAFVNQLGAWGPIAFIGILAFRFLFLVPTSLLLLAAGLLFGAVFGTLYAGIGLFLSGMVKYAIALTVGRDALLKQLPDKVRDWVASLASRNLSAWALTGLCAYPFMPKHAFQIAAILSGMRISIYALAVLAGGFIQAAMFAFIGEAIFTESGLITATAVMLAALLLPLCVPSWRRWLVASMQSHQHKDIASS